MLVVVKPSSAKDIVEHTSWLEKEIASRKLDCRWFYTSGHFDVDRKAIKESLDKIHTVVVIGGDGTLHLVANALANTQVAVAVLPAGTGNDFARQFNLTIPQWRERIFSGTLHAIDLGRVNRRYFINIAGIGFNAAVVKDMDTFQHRHKLSYIFAGIKHLVSFKHISSTDQSLMRVFANGQFFAAGLKAAPSASVTNGKLLMLHFKAHSLLNRVWSFVLMLLQCHENSRLVDVHNVSEFAIEEPGLLIEADGEIVGETPAIVKVCPAALKIKL